MLAKKISKQLAKRLSSALLALFLLSAQFITPLLFVQKAYAANAAADLDQCRNGTLASPAQCIDSGGSVGWVNGNAGASDSHWREGDSLAYRMRFSNLTVGAHSVSIEWDTTKAGKHALDYLTTFNRTETTADPCSGVAGCGSPTTFAIPDDPNSTVTQVPGVLTLYNGTITSLSAYSLSGTYAGDSSTSLTINFDAGNASPVLAWSAHIASQLDWGFGNSASAVNGSPYHTRLLNLDGAGGNQDRSLAAAAVFPTPTMNTQVSSSTVTVGQTVTDTATAVGPSQNSPTVTGTMTFFICGPGVSNPDCTTGGSQVGSPVTMSSGQATSSPYTVAQPGNYCFRAEYVPAADAPYSPQNHTNLTTECFNASFAPSSITIIKDAVPNGPQDFQFTTSGSGLSDFALDDDNDPTLSNSKVFNNLLPGTYSVTEVAVSGWDFDNISCSQGASVQKNGTTVTITLSAGQNVVCTYTNRQRGQIIVHKVTNPANDPTGFQITASGSGNISGNATRTLTTAQDVTYDVSQGTYGVTEQVPNGWTQTGNTCSNLVINGNTPLVNGVPTLTCTITNVKLAKLKIVKDAVPNDGQDFTFTISGNGLSPFMLDDDSDATLSNNQQFINLMPGSYSVTEGAVTGWDLTGLVCSGTNNYSHQATTLGVTLAAGDDVTCTFTNTKRGSIAGVKFEDMNGNGIFDIGEPLLSDWTITLWSGQQQLSQAVTGADGSYSFTNLVAGTYTLTENLLTGWTQTLAPGPVNLSAGQSSTDNNFGNFHNGEVHGYKFNDLNGNGSPDSGEPKLAGWQINLYGLGQDNQLNNLLASTTTDAGGNYSFSDLAPGTYKVCEVLQTGWVQTYPVSNGGCTVFVIDQSGETNSANFGNQGHGTITVIKNVDSDGDGQVDQQDVTNWVWDINGGSDQSTGSANHIDTVAGSYTVSEHQKANFHITASSCTGEDQVAPSTQVSVTVSAGENVVCTFVNTRDTGTVTVNKIVNPANDNGQFNLNVDGQAYVTNVGNGGTTGPVTVITGSHNASEAAGDDTSLDDYTSSFSCSNELSGQGTSTPSFTVSSGQNITCTFVNTRYSKIIVTKFFDANENGIFDEGEQTLPDWEINLMKKCLDNNESFIAGLQDCEQFNLTQTTGQDGTTTFSKILPGDYKVSENLKDGWVQSALYCTGDNEISNPVQNPYIKKSAGYVDLGAGQTRYCFVGNHHKPELDIAKSNDQPNPVMDGAIVTYSITVSVPNVDQSGRVYGTINGKDYFPVEVTDVLPAGFDYIPGSWTATSNVRGDLRVAGITPEPINGVWDLTTPSSNFLLPGEVITLTYQAKIADTVTPGTYTNVAVGKGFDNPCKGHEVDTQFVTSSVTVVGPPPTKPFTPGQVLGESILVNTGTAWQPAQFILPVAMILGTIYLSFASKRYATKKGANR